MPSADSIAVAAQLSLVQSVDDGRSSTDPCKLPKWLRQQVDGDLDGLDVSDSETLAQGAEQSSRSALVRKALDQMEEALRDGYKGIDAIRAAVITEEDRAKVFAAYGWSGGLLGRFDLGRTVGLARLGIREHPEVPVKYRYAPELIADLRAAVADYNRLVPESVDGALSGGVQNRNAKLEAAEQTLSQVRHAYCMASRLTVKNPELLKIGFRPRRPQRTKEEIDLTKQRAVARQEERRLKRLQQIDEREQRQVERLTAALESTRLDAQRERENLNQLPVQPEVRNEPPQPQAQPQPQPQAVTTDEMPLSS